MKKIVPAILTNDPADLEIKIRQSEQFTEIAQIDIMDGKFVPSMSVGSEDLKKVKTKLYLEVHIMAVDPERYFEPFRSAGAKRIIFHFESTDRPAELVRMLREMNVLPGIAINPGTPLDAVRPLFGDIDMLLLMAVNPGFYGSPFIPEVLNKARELSKEERKFILALDGGVKQDNFMEIVNSGVEQIDIGSGIFKGNPAENYRKFLEQLK